MYKLFSRVDGGIPCIIQYLSSYLKETGRGMVSEEPGIENSPGRNAVTYVQNLLDLRDQYNMFLDKSFSNDPLFKHAIGQVLILVFL